MIDVEVHRQTDEAFILFAGTAVLVAAEIGDEGISFECVRMTPGVTYNIPARGVAQHRHVARCTHDHRRT